MCTLKYELVNDDSRDVSGVEVFHIKALKDFGDIKAGDLGGYIQSESNLSQDGTCWVGDNCVAFSNAIISGAAIIKSDDKHTNVGEDMFDVIVGDNTTITGDSVVTGIVTISSSSITDAYVHMHGDVDIDNFITDYATIYGTVIKSGSRIEDCEYSQFFNAEIYPVAVGGKHIWRLNYNRYISRKITS